MSLILSGDGQVTGLAVGGLPDGTVDSGTIATGSILPADLASGTGGKLLQVVQTHVTTTSSQAVPGATPTNVNNLNATITPSATDSKILVKIRATGEWSVAVEYDCVWGIHRDTTVVGSAPAAGVRPLGLAQNNAGYHAADAASTMDSSTYEYIDSPATTAAVVYHATIQHRAAGTFYNNRTVTDGDGVNYERLTSTITLMEIGA